MAFDFDLFVIGGGSGGVRAARIAAQHGARVGLAEEYRYGGTCVIRGCVPKKLMVYASRFADEFEDAAGYGWSVGERSFDWPTLIANKDREIARLEVIYKTNLEKAGVKTYESRATLAGPQAVTLEATGEQVTAERILIATGGTPFIDESLAGHEHVISSNEVFHLREKPRRVIVAGGGYIAVEFAGIFAGLGAETTLLYRGEQILRGFDREIRDNLAEQMRSRGVDIITGAVFREIVKTETGLLGRMTNRECIEVDQIMFAIGRRPNVKGLGLEALGIAQRDNGAIMVDEWSQTNVPSVYAVGDVTDRVNLTPVAIREGHAFADTVYGDRPRTMDHETVPTAVFSAPELGTVGLSEEEARAKYDALDIYKTSFRALKTTLTDRSERVFYKIIVDAETDRVLGVHMMGDGAGELIQTLGILVKMGATKADFDATVAVHPTAAEELVTMREPSERVRKAAA